MARIENKSSCSHNINLKDHFSAFEPLEIDLNKEKEKFVSVSLDCRFQESNCTGFRLWFDKGRICRSRPTKHYIPHNNWGAKV